MKPEQITQLNWVSAAGALAYMVFGKYHLKQEEGKTPKMQILNEDTFQFFHERKVIKEKKEPIFYGAAEHKGFLSVQVVAQVIAHYTEGTGVLCVDFEANVLSDITSEPPSRMSSFIRESTVKISDELRMRRALATEDDHATAVRNTVASADEFYKLVQDWCVAHFDSIGAVDSSIKPREPEPTL